MIDRPYIYALTVTRVIDGDTIVGDLDVGFEMVFQNRKFRFFGIDTPELNSKDPAVREKANAAKDFVTLALLGKRVLIKTVKNRAGADTVDSFGRYLAIVYNPADGSEVNEALLAAGLAVVYRP